MTSSLRDGVPKESDYTELLDSALFREMEGFSDEFLQSYKGILAEYMRSWVMDPLHQWSRQWEYPYVFDRLMPLLQGQPGPSILDAGSGATFFPYYLLGRSASASIHCCDNDAKLEKVYEGINRQSGKDISFSAGDLRNIPFENESFDALYCVSVLEHTNDYVKIIDEFYRVLKPGGILVVTFDISLDGTRDIGVERACALLDSLVAQFGSCGGCPVDLESLISAPCILTTMGAKAIRKDSLPWKFPAFLYQARTFMSTGLLIPWPPSLTVFCLSLAKSAS